GHGNDGTDHDHRHQGHHSGRRRRPGTLARRGERGDGRDHGGPGHRVPDRGPGHGAADAGRDRRRDRWVRGGDASPRPAGGNPRRRAAAGRHLRHRRRRLRHLQHLDHRRLRDRRRRGPGRQARQPGGDLQVRLGRSARRAGGADRADPGAGGALRRGGRDRVHVRAGVPPGDAVRRPGPARNRNPDHLQRARAVDQPGRGAAPTGRRRPPGHRPQAGRGAGAARQRPRGAGPRRGGPRRNRDRRAVGGHRVRRPARRGADLRRLAGRVWPHPRHRGRPPGRRRGGERGDHAGDPVRRTGSAALDHAAQRRGRDLRRRRRRLLRRRDRAGGGGDRLRPGVGQTRRIGALYPGPGRRRNGGDGV
ncbi:MAG: Anthranilate phosphoribosyltransferase, partial [uncultured Thermomicrobiales bacterium]